MSLCPMLSRLLVRTRGSVSRQVFRFLCYWVITFIRSVTRTRP